jgi:hypothetical protein
MNVRHNSSWRIATTLAVIGIGVFANKLVAIPGPGESERGVDVLMRGPVHEAFAETVTFNPEPGLVVSRAPREIIEEVPPDQRPEGDNITWIPGYWAWDDERSDFLWVSGIWRDLPPGRQWVPGYWGHSGHGNQWTSGYWADASENEVEYLPEPPESMEEGPSSPPPAPNLGWVPGSWIWHQGRYAWRPGYWAAGRADWDWVPAHYIWAPRGYVFSDGYWDYPVERRGVLFAPVYFEEEVYSRRDYRYSPSFAINLNVFSDQLFVRPRYQHYYFGDYYDRRYEDTGFFASFSFQSSRRGYDPIYAHRRWANRNDRDWDRRDRDNFSHRREFADSRPPRSLNAQRERNSRTTRPGENRFDAASPFEQLVKGVVGGGSTRYRAVGKSERDQLSQRGRSIQNTRGERQRLETRSGNSPNDRTSRSAGPERVKLPKSSIVGKALNLLGKGQAPPQRHRTPASNPNIAPRVKRADSSTGSNRSQSDNRAGQQTHGNKSQPQDRKTDRDRERDQPKRDSKDRSKGDSKDQREDDKKKDSNRKR